MTSGSCCCADLRRSSVCSLKLRCKLVIGPVCFADSSCTALFACNTWTFKEERPTPPHLTVARETMPFLHVNAFIRLGTVRKSSRRTLDSGMGIGRYNPVVVTRKLFL